MSPQVWAAVCDVADYRRVPGIFESSALTAAVLEFYTCLRVKVKTVARVSPVFRDMATGCSCVQFTVEKICFIISM